MSNGYSYAERAKPHLKEPTDHMRERANAISKEPTGYSYASESKRHLKEPNVYSYASESKRLKEPNGYSYMCERANAISKSPVAIHKAANILVHVTQRQHINKTFFLNILT
jgi:hypothetical protein